MNCLHVLDCNAIPVIYSRKAMYEWFLRNVSFSPVAILTKFRPVLAFITE